MEIRPPEIHQSKPSDSVVGEVPFDDDSTFSPGMSVSEDTLTGSSPFSHSETLNHRALVVSSPNQIVSSMSLPTEALEDQIIAPLPSSRSVSPPNSNSKTLDDCPLFPSHPNPNGSYSTGSVETPDDMPLSPLVPQSSTLDGSSPPMPTAAENDDSHTFYDSDREVQEEDPDPIGLLNDFSYNPSLSSSKQWPSWSSSSSQPSKEAAWNSGLTSEETWLSSEDAGTPLRTAFSDFGIVPFTVGAGLANLGNTCFINAILQCFTHTVPLIQGLRSYSHSAPCEGGVDGFCVLCTLRDHIEHSLTSGGAILSPLKLVDNLNYFSSSFRRYQQEDAHEFMQCVLDKLEGCFLDLKKKESSEQVDNLVEKIFGGRLISKLQCCNCGRCSDTYEPLIDFSLEIENVDTLPSALESFTKVEKIDAKFRCDSCKEEVSMEKQLILDQIPSVAAFHLKRFKTDGTYVEKIENHVEFPLELDLQPYTCCNQSNNEALKYDLYAIVVHVGFSSTSGHYFCFVRSAPDMWYRLDDSKVTRVPGDFVRSQEAYILFYARQGTPWLSSIMEASRSCLGPSILNTSPKSVLDNVDSLYSSDPSIANFVSCDTSEPKEFAKHMSNYSCGERNEVLEVNDVIDASHGTGQFHSELNQVIVGSNGSRDDTTHAEVSCNERNGTLLSLDKSNTHQEVVDIRENDGFHPLTPPSSPGSDECSPDMNYHIPRDHLKKDNRESCRRPLSKSVEDSKRKEAMRYLTRSMPGARRSKLMGFLTEPDSEGSSNKRRKKMDSLACKKAIPPSDRKKSNHSSVMRAVAAGISR